MYPGRADVREGDSPEFRIENASHGQTVPAELTVRSGTEVSWINHTTASAFVRFEDVVPEVCAEPHRFRQTRDADTLASDWLAPFQDARLCVTTAGRYRFIVTLAGIRSAGEDPAVSGTLIVVP